jgi:hypothetical protein
MVTTGQMSYGNPQHHPSSPPHHPWRVVFILVALALVLGLSSGWVSQNWRTFNSNADIGLCHVADGRC